MIGCGRDGCHQVVQRLLKDRSDVNARNEDGMNALMLGSQVCTCMDVHARVYVCVR